MKKIYTGIDFGSNYIKVVVAEVIGKCFHVLAHSIVKSKGIKKGIIIDSDETVKSLKIAIKEVEDAIFHVLKCVFLIFRDFQFSRHIPGPSVCISHFSRFLVISSFFKSSSGCFSFSMIFSFLAIFHVLQWTVLIFQLFSVFLAIFHVLKCVFLIFRDFQFSHHIPGPTVCIFIFHVFQ